MTALTVEAASPRQRSRVLASVPWVFAGLVLLLIVFGPVIANDVPLIARVDGSYSFPAFADLFGAAPPGPGDTSWKVWWKGLSEGGSDFAVFPPCPYGAGEVNLDLIAAGPSAAHPFGNDDTGRDVLARIIGGARVTVGLSLLGVLLAAVVGTLLGALAGVRRGWVDTLVLRLVEVFLCFPGLLLLMVVAAFFGSSSVALVMAFGLAMWPSFARIVRGELLSLRERDFVVVARGLGVSERRVLFRHLLPQTLGQVAVTAAFCAAAAITAEATLSFLGIGPGVQGGSWGSILAQGKANAHLGLWHLWLIPGLVIVATVMCCHTLADRLRETRRSA